MSMQYDVKAVQATESGSLFAGPTRVKGVYISAGADAGFVDLNDGGSSGTALCSFDFTANSTQYVLIPGEGIRFNTNLYLTASVNTASFTVFYG